MAKDERIYADPFESVDIYTKQCSVGVTAAQLARMGATLANHGINPGSGQQVIKREDIPIHSRHDDHGRLYDGSGGWAWHVGLPSKSGVGGGIVAVVPGKGAIAVFAPPLDEAGNSIKAQKVISNVAKKLDINLYSPGSVGIDVVAPPNQEKYLKVYHQYAPLWSLLDKKTSEKVRKGNYVRIFDEARHKVRAWERAHVNSASAQ